MKRLAENLLLITLFSIFIISLTRFPNHLTDPSWPVHAKSHITSQIFIMSGISAAQAGLLWYNRKTPINWVFWTLVGYGCLILGGYWAGKLIFEIATWRTGNSVFLALTLTYCTGLILYLSKLRKINER